MRRLRSTRRHVPLDRAEEYLLEWTVARRLIEAAGARAWLFRGEAHEDHFLEFMEWKDGAADPGDTTAIAGALDALDAIAPAGATELWEEAG